MRSMQRAEEKGSVPQRVLLLVHNDDERKSDLQRDWEANLGEGF